MTTMAVVAHYDDEVLGMGGTLASLVDPYVYVLCVPPPNRQAIWQANEVWEMLGAQRVCSAYYEDQTLDTVPVAQVADMIRAQLCKYQPDTVYTHFSGDLNADHRVISEAVRVAARPYVTEVKRIYEFEIPSNTEYGEPFKPNVFRELTDKQMDVKCAAMAMYDTETPDYPHPRHPNSLRHRARYWGSQVEMTYAEPFILVREIQ